MSPTHKRVLATALVAALTLPSPALAYLDPGTGSMIITAIVGLFASAALAVKTYWYRIKRFFKGGSPAPEEEAD